MKTAKSTKNTKSNKKVSARKTAQITKSSFLQKYKAQIAVASAFVLVFGGFGIYTLRNSSAYSNCTSNQYRLNSRGTCVKYIQQMQNGLSVALANQSRNGYTIKSTRLTADGVFGSATTSKVKTWQGFSRLQVDGIVGKQTWTTMCSTVGAINRIKPNSSTAMNTAYTAAKNANCKLIDPGLF